MSDVLPIGWTRTTLGDAVGGLDYGYTASATTAPQTHKFLRITDVVNGPIDWKGVPYCRVGDQDARKYGLADGDVVIARTGATVGVPGYVQEPPAAVFASYLLRLRRSARHDSRFLYYCLRSRDWKNFIDGFASGKSAQPNVSASSMGEYVLSLPPIAEQRAIAGVLGALDDKIESNRRICGLVDGLVRSEFQRLAPTESSKSVAVGDIINRVHQAADPSRLSPSTGYIGLEHMPRGLMILDQWGTAEGLDSGKSFFEKSDVLFGKLRPNFRKVGVAPLAGICSTDILVLRPKPGFSVALALAVLTSEEVLGPAIAASSGTKMPRISWDYIAALPVRVPSTSGCDEFADLVDPMIQVAMTSVLENVTLQNTRDALLPELLSGRLRVKDAEKIVEGAV